MKSCQCCGTVDFAEAHACAHCGEASWSPLDAPDDAPAVAAPAPASDNPSEPPPSLPKRRGNR